MSEVLPLRMILPPSSPSNRHLNTAHQNNNDSQQFHNNSANNSISKPVANNGSHVCVAGDVKRWCHNSDIVIDDGVSRIMSCHPNYKDPFQRTHYFILNGDGPLSYATRHYIAIMASARHQCRYLVDISCDEFLSSGGDPQWLQGLAHIPQKLKDLNQINKLLAHQPWLLNKTHIEKLTKGSDSWSLSELVHAIVILAHFHALSSFVFGCNIGQTDGHTNIGDNSGDEKENGHNRVVTSNNSDNSNSNGGNNAPPSPTTLGSSPTGIEVETLMKKMQSISEQKGMVMAMEDSVSVGSQEDLQMKTTSLESLLSSSNNASSPTITAVDDSHQLQSDLVKFIDDPHFGYEDFARKREDADVPTFRVQDYSWDDHGFSLVNRLYSDVGNLLDEKFKVCYNLTYFNMGHKTNIDTSPFRRAIWNYIQSMYGIRHDDYDYREVNILLERNLKSYIKSLCCYPHRVSKSDYCKVMRGFRSSEKIHVNMMIFEARLQAELLYALRAVMRHMT